MRYFIEDIRDIVQVQSTLCLPALVTQMRDKLILLEGHRWFRKTTKEPWKTNRNLLTILSSGKKDIMKGRAA